MSLRAQSGLKIQSADLVLLLPGVPLEHDDLGGGVVQVGGEVLALAHQLVDRLLQGGLALVHQRDLEMKGP